MTFRADLWPLPRGAHKYPLPHIHIYTITLHTNVSPKGHSLYLMWSSIKFYESGRIIMAPYTVIGTQVICFRIPVLREMPGMGFRTSHEFSFGKL